MSAVMAREIGLKEYFAKQGSGYRHADAEIIGPELEKLAADGHMTARDIVTVAREENSPLRPYFEWQDDVAATLYREDQARHMARSIMVKVVDQQGFEQEVRAFHAVRLVVTDGQEQKREKGQKAYVTVQQVQDDPDKAKQVVDEALNYLAGWKNRYAVYRSIFPTFNEQFKGVFEAIDNIQELNA